jgi:hypothetical protein
MDPRIARFPRQLLRIGAATSRTTRPAAASPSTITLQSKESSRA